jgi:hypothetical protein
MSGCCGASLAQYEALGQDSVPFAGRDADSAFEIRSLWLESLDAKASHLSLSDSEKAEVA